MITERLPSVIEASNKLAASMRPRSDDHGKGVQQPFYAVDVVRLQ